MPFSYQHRSHGSNGCRRRRWEADRRCWTWKRAMTAAGTGSGLMREESAGSPVAQTRVSRPSTATASCTISRCSTSKRDDRNSLTCEVSSTRSPNRTAARKRALASTSGRPMMPNVDAKSGALVPSALSNNVHVPQSKNSKKRLLNTIPAGSQCAHSIRNCERLSKVVIGALAKGSCSRGRGIAQFFGTVLRLFPYLLPEN
jgi:hypothetical protein